MHRWYMLLDEQNDIKIYFLSNTITNIMIYSFTQEPQGCCYGNHRFNGHFFIFSRKLNNCNFSHKILEILVWIER